MTVRKMLIGVVAVVCALVFAADAQALGKRKNKSCNSCATAAPAGCSGCGGCGMAMAGPGGVAVAAPEAMPKTATATTTPPTTVTPVAGTETGVVVPAGYTTVVDPNTTTTRTRRGLIRR